MLLHLRGFHVKGDSRPPSQSPMRIDKLSANILCLQSKAARHLPGGFALVKKRWGYPYSAMCSTQFSMP